MMKRVATIAAAILLFTACGTQNENDKVNIQKQTIQLDNDQMTPEALWAMSRIGGYQASPDGQHIVFQTGYYSVEENKSHQVLWMMHADGTEQKQLTTDADNETDAQWLDNETIAFLKGGEIWKMNLDGGQRKQLSETEGKVEGFQFSPDGTKVILLKSIDFNEIIKKNPEDLPKATGRLVTDLMYRHWDHYVETIQHPFVTNVTMDNGQWIIDNEANYPFSIVNCQLLAKRVKHVLTHRVIYADFYLLETDERPELPADYIWVKEADLGDYGVPRLVEKLFEEIHKRR